MTMRSYMMNVPIVRALATRMQGSSMRAALSALAVAEPNYAGKLVMPQLVVPYAPLPTSLTAFPAIGFVDAESAFEDDIGSSVTGYHEVGIVVYLSDPDPDQLAWGLRLYLQAVVTAALENRSLGTGSTDGAWGTGAKRILPGPGILQDEDPLSRAMRSFAWSTFVLWARRDEI